MAGSGVTVLFDVDFVFKLYYLLQRAYQMVNMLYFFKLFVVYEL